MRRVVPGAHDADVEGRVPVADPAEARIDVLGGAVKRLEQDLDRGFAVPDDPFEQVLDQLAGQLADEMTLPVVAVLSVR